MEFWYLESTVQFKGHRLSSVSHTNWSKTNARLDQQIPSRLRRSDIGHDVTSTSTIFLQLHKKCPHNEIHVHSGDTTLSSLACARDIFIVMTLFQWKVKIMRYVLLVRVRSVTSRILVLRADVVSLMSDLVTSGVFRDILSLMVEERVAPFHFSDIDACHCNPLLRNSVRHVNRIGDYSLISPILTVSLPSQITSSSSDNVSSSDVSSCSEWFSCSTKSASQMLFSRKRWTSSYTNWIQSSNWKYIFTGYFDLHYGLSFFWVNSHQYSHPFKINYKSYHKSRCRVVILRISVGTTQIRIA